MHTRKQANPQITPPFSRAGEKISREPLRGAREITVGNVRREKIVRTARQLVERTQQRPKGSALLDRWMAGSCRHRARHLI
jgi:hypothetical protein